VSRAIPSGRAAALRAEPVPVSGIASIPIAGRDGSADAYIASIRTDPENREPNDFYPTHPGATKALLSVEAFDGQIWEPACGEGDISRVLIDAGHDVISHELIDRGFGEVGRDFLLAKQSVAPNVVTNPPFKLASEFVEQALALTTGKVAFFLRLAFLEGVERGGKFPRQPLARVWVMSRRVPMWRGEVRDEIGSLMAMAWFVWEHGHQGPPSLGWLDWQRIEDAKRQGSLFGEAA